LLILHERGWGKRVPLEEYNAKGRYTQGMWTTDHTRLDEVGPIVAARVVHEQDQITVMTSNGLVLRTAVSGIRSMGRSTRGVRVVNLQEGDTVAAVAVLTYADLNRAVDGGVQDDSGLPVTSENGALSNGNELPDTSDEPVDEMVDENEQDAMLDMEALTSE